MNDVTDINYTMIITSTFGYFPKIIHGVTV